LNGIPRRRAADRPEPGRLPPELRAFYELARAVGGSPYDVGALLDRICAEVRQLFGFERAMLVRYDSEERSVHAVVQQNVEWPGEQWLWIDRFPFLERALVERRAVFVRDARFEPAMPDKIRERFGVHSIVAVPLCVQARCLGFLVFDNAGGEFDLSPDEVELLTTLGWVAAVFVDKADRYEELEHSLNELSAVDRVKSDFVSIASHELKTPIAVVHGIASTLHLRGNQLDRSQLEELRRTLYEHTSLLSTLTDELLDLSRLDAGAVTPHPERFRPREQIEVLLPTIAPDRVSEIDIDVPPRLEVVTDPDGFTRIVSNLVTNALRHGRPPVEVRSEHNVAFKLIVQDSGEGVDPEFVPRLFDRFARCDSTRRKRVGGAGLGLAIARSFARTLGGDLVYEPARPHGASFALVLPAEVVANTGEPLVPPWAPSSQAEW
jgi:signal transduction histidine kinase